MFSCKNREPILLLPISLLIQWTHTLQTISLLFDVSTALWSSLMHFFIPGSLIQTPFNSAPTQKKTHWSQHKITQDKEAKGSLCWTTLVYMKIAHQLFTSTIKTSNSFPINNGTETQTAATLIQLNSSLELPIYLFMYLEPHLSPLCGPLCSWSARPIYELFIQSSNLRISYKFLYLKYKTHSCTITKCSFWV